MVFLWLLLLVPSGLSVIYCGRFALNATAILFTENQESVRRPKLIHRQ